MSEPTSSALGKALNRDLKKMGSEGLSKVVNDAARKTFTARVHGAILEFAHKQPDSAFWTGVKYYGSGSNSRIRIRRTADETPAVVVEKTVRRKKPAAVAVAI